MLSIIVAVAENNVIGKNNGLIWHLPEDLKRFKKLTTGHTIIMGSNTFESLGRVLPNRKHIVLAYDPNYKVEDENVIVINDMEKLNDYINEDEENFIIGGASIYRQFVSIVDKLYITKIHQDFEGDVYFPEIDERDWKVIEKIKGIKDNENPYDYEYITYVRK